MGSAPEAIKTTPQWNLEVIKGHQTFYILTS